MLERPFYDMHGKHAVYWKTCRVLYIQNMPCRVQNDILANFMTCLETATYVLRWETCILCRACKACRVLENMPCPVHRKYAV